MCAVLLHYGYLNFFKISSLHIVWLRDLEKNKNKNKKKKRKKKEKAKEEEKRANITTMFTVRDGHGA